MPIEVESPEQLGYGNIACNLAESSVMDMDWKKLKFNPEKLSLCYGDHAGLPELRELIAKEHDLKPEHILLVPGASAGLFIVATALLNKTSRLMVEKPNYATNIETPRMIGCEIDYLDLNFNDGFKPDLYKLSILAKKEHALISVTSPHNPSGSVLTFDELTDIIQIAKRANSYLLVDETYRDLSMTELPPLAATLSDKVISVSSMSKAYGLPGIRIGWIACKNARLMETFLAAKEQIFICNSVLDENVALHFMQNKTKFVPKIQKHVHDNFKLLSKWMQNNPYMEWVKPEGGVVCFPRIKVKIDYKKFNDVLLNQHQTMVGYGHWFEMPSNYMRLGFGWPSKDELQNGLNNIEKTIEQLLG